MPTTVVYVDRVDKSRFNGRLESYDDYLVTGMEAGAYTMQFHTTSEFRAAACQRAKELGRPVSIVWRDHRVGRQIVDVDILEREAVA